MSSVLGTGPGAQLVLCCQSGSCLMCTQVVSCVTLSLGTRPSRSLRFRRHSTEQECNPRVWQGGCPNGDSDKRPHVTTGASQHCQSYSWGEYKGLPGNLWGELSGQSKGQGPKAAGIASISLHASVSLSVSSCVQ